MFRRSMIGMALVFVLTPGWAAAGSLAGQVGHKRFPVTMPNDPKDQCRVAYNKYVAASGHSAYAATVRAWPAVAFFCGTALNAPSQQAAEQQALKNCQSLFKRYKMTTVGRCQIYASK